MFLGRRKIAGLSPGRRVLLEGVVANDRKHVAGVTSQDNDCLMYNPVYELSLGLPAASPGIDVLSRL